jgi:asparaginyl-tRNA synthetase
MAVVYLSKERGLDTNDDSYGVDIERPWKSLPHAVGRIIFKLENGSKAKPYRVNELLFKKTCSDFTFFDIDANHEIEFTPSGLKKLKTRVESTISKFINDEKAKLAEERKEKARLRDLELSKSIVISKPPNYDLAVSANIDHVLMAYNRKREDKGPLYKLQGWVDSVRRHGNKLMFVNLRDGSSTGEQIQVLFTGTLCKTYDALTLQPESCISVWGKVRESESEHEESRKRFDSTLPPCLTDYEFVAEYWELIGSAPVGGLESKLNRDSGLHQITLYRHLANRTRNMRNMLIFHGALTQSVHHEMRSQGVTLVHLPSFVQTQCEGGSTLFKVPYFGDPDVYLTQSSQLYLETLVPVLNNVYCMQSSFRAENSNTRRHLTEYLHLEAEYGNITFEKLLDRIESLVVSVVEEFNTILQEDTMVWDGPKPTVKELKKPFRRMLYTDAITWLNEHGILNEGDVPFKFGDDIPEKPERMMVDTIGEPIFLCKFPAALKSFYMERDPENELLTLSTDLLLPNVGEVVGGSMRMWHTEELLSVFKKQGIPHESYEWYIDQRRFGSCPHGGFGLGFERLLAYLLDLHTVQYATAYPRTVSIISP